jgi:hypothetical protein
MTIKDVIDIEKRLLQTQESKRFEMDLSELIVLNKYIKEVGEITSLYFNTLYEYSKTINKIEKLTEYKEKMDNSYISEEIDFYSIKRFLNMITEKYNREAS